MKRIVAGICSLLILFAAGCSAKPQGPDFVVPTPAAVEEPTPVPEPVPTQKPESEYNELLDTLRFGSAGSGGMRTHDYPTRAHGIENNSTITLLVTVLEKENILYQTDHGTWDGYQRGKVVVEKCFRGNFQEGDVLEIKEIAHIVTDEGETWLNSRGYFFPTREHETYLLFLDKPDTEYLIAEDHCGKFPVTPAFAEACESGELTFSAMEYLQSDAIRGGGYDRNIPPQDEVNLCQEIYAKYYQDEAILKILEEEKKYEEHYGRPEPAPIFEPVPEGENLLWVYTRNHVIYVPATVVSDADPIEAVHDKMNGKGFAPDELQTLIVDSTEFRMWINDADVSFAARREEQFSTETVTSVYDLNGELISEGVESHECMKLIGERGFEPVVISVTTRLYWEDETTCYHASFIVDVDENSYLF